MPLPPASAPDDLIDGAASCLITLRDHAVALVARQVEPNFGRISQATNKLPKLTHTISSSKFRVFTNRPVGIRLKVGRKSYDIQSTTRPEEQQ
jgi:hypothetical protein